MDHISKFISQVRVAIMNKKLSLVIQNSKIMLMILWVLYKEGFIAGYHIDGVKISVFLRYYKEKNSLKNIKQISKISRRIYVTYKDLRVEDRYSLHSVVTAPTGIFLSKTKEQCRLKKGGELLFKLQ